MKTDRYAGLILLLLFILLLPKTSIAQSEKLYAKGMKAFFKEDFDKAIEYFEEIESSGRTFKDTKYRNEISYLVQRKYRERDLGTMLSFRQYKAKSDKFFHYWMGRIYANRYNFPEAVDSWKIFLSMKDYKSEEIIEETQNFLEHAELMVKYFDNPDNYEVHQLRAPINTEFAELSPVFSGDNARLIFTSNRNNAATDLFEVFQSSSSEIGWNSPKLIPSIGKISREKANIEIVNEDGKLFIFKEEKKNSGDLFFSELINENWSTPVEFDNKITSTHLKSHFFINEHEDRIIFSAPNKEFGLDIFESFKNSENGQWEDPHPFSPSVNSGFDEDSPFLSADESKFYFSSDKPGGIGGFDVYVSTFDEKSKTWSKAENIGWPINSPDDEQFFKMNPDGNSGYFSTNRIHSIGDYDIFYFWEIQKTTVEGRVLYAHNEAPITKGEVRFHPTQYLDEYFRSTIDEDGNYEAEIIANEIFRVEIMDGFDTLLTQPFALVDVDGAEVTHYKDFFVIAKDLSEEETLKYQAQYASEQVIPKAKEMFAPVKKVSQPKEEAVSEKVIVAAEIEEKVAPEPVKPESKSQNIVTEKNDTSIKKATYSYHYPMEIGTQIARVFFQYNTSQLTKASIPMLEKVVSFLKDYPSLKVEVAGHTDNFGSEKTNEMVSVKRAETVKSWMVNKGINPERIITVGFGETRPIASNDDEENGRELNRRIEVKTLSK